MPRLRRGLLATFILLASYSLLYFRGIFRVHRRTEIFSEVPLHHGHFGLIVDTPGCKIPKLNPYDKTVMDLIVKKSPYVCGGDPVFLMTMPKTTLLLNQTILRTAYNISPEDVACSYTSIHRIGEPDGEIGEDFIEYGQTKELVFGVPLNEEFLKIDCLLGARNFTQYVPLVPIKPEVEKRASVSRPNSSDSLNVILIGIDSVSKLNFLRHFRRTHRFLTSNVSSAFDMKGYTKVADNTFPNLVPLLTGHFVEHYWNESLRNEMFFDDLDFIWRTYSRNGYRTFYAEDSPFTGTFNYQKRGFKEPPTDYYFRTLGLALEGSDLRERSKRHCLNNQLETEIIYGYLKDFVRTMEHRPYFAFAMVSTLTHDSLNTAGYADEPTYNLLKEFRERGVMNRSIVVIFSDHGLRFGKIRETYIGKYEERMPFMYVILPDWFLEKHPSISSSLSTNQNRLITLFDVHATLFHMLDPSRPIPKNLKSTVTPNGLSLLEEIPEDRTCETANILPHWCTCQINQPVPMNDQVVKKAASAIVDEINKQLEPFKDICVRLELVKITYASVRQANDMVLTFVKHENVVLNRYVVYGNKVSTISDYLVTLRACPGGGMFEGSVRHNWETGTFKVLGISRINMYGDQSDCVPSQVLKKFCFCKKNIRYHEPCQ